MRKADEIREQVKNIEDEPSVFITRVRKVMASDGVNGTELARRLNTTRAYTSALLNGGRRPMLATAIKVAKALDVSLDWLCGLED